MNVNVGRATWDAETVKAAAIPHLPTLLGQWGVTTTGRISQSGFIECHAIGREDTNPSAGVNIATGVYSDLGGGMGPLSLFELAVAAGAFPDFHAAVNAIGEHLGVEPASGPVARPATPRPARRTPRPVPTAPNPTPPRQNRGHATFAAAVESSLRSPRMAGFEVVAEYRYSPTIVVVRFEKHEDGRRVGKSFRPYHRAEDGRWRVGDPPGERPFPLFGLADLGPAGVVCFLEGEKCRDITAGIGLSAVACAHGAQSPGLTDSGIGPSKGRSPRWPRTPTFSGAVTAWSR